MPRRPEETYTLADLEAWAEPGVHLAVLGHPVKHSLSPHLHNAALRLMAAADPRLREWRYWKIDVPPDRLAEALPLLHARGFHGVNLTVPHKILALELVERVDPDARAIGAVNTLCRRPGGYEGFNTDGHGLATAVAADLGVPLAGADVVVLGAGGAARSAAVECVRRGCRALWLGNRSRDALDRLLAVVRPHAGATPIRAFVFPEPPPALPVGALVINATSAGLRPGDAPPCDLAPWPQPAAVFDMIYNPPETALLAAARARGARTANGLAMLVHQGARALELWTGRPVPAAEMERAARLALSSPS